MDAYGVFAEGVKEVRLLTGQDPLREGLGGDEALSSALERGACVLLVSHFEGFLKDLAERMVDALVDSRVAMKHVPASLRELHSLPRLEDVVRSSDQSHRAALLKKLGDVAYLWNPEARLEPGRLDSSVVARVITNAAADCIDQLFHLFGEKSPVCDGHLDVASGGGGSAPMPIRARLKDIVDCRNDIAHGVADRKVTHEDVDRYTAFLDALAQRLCALAEMRVSELTAARVA